MMAALRDLVQAFISGACTYASVTIVGVGVPAFAIPHWSGVVAGIVVAFVALDRMESERGEGA